MTTEKPYPDPELKIEQLASWLSIPVKMLSQVINESLNQSFLTLLTITVLKKQKVI
jgi:hypothetical protein